VINFSPRNLKNYRTDLH